MFCGPQKLADNMVCIAPSDVGCFSKSAHLPLVLSHPYSSLVREVFLADRVKAVYAQLGHGSNGSSSSSGGTAMEVDTTKDDDDKDTNDAESLKTTTKALLGGDKAADSASVELALWTLQRQARASLIAEYIKCHAIAEKAKAASPPVFSSAATTHHDATGSGSEEVVVVAGGACGVHAPCSTGTGGLLTLLAPRKMFVRTKKQAKRDIRQFEKDERRKRTETQKQRSQRSDEYLKELLTHREDFFRFHKAKRIEAKKAATAVRVWFENSDVRREKSEQRAEAARVKALKENDMEVRAW